MWGRRGSCDRQGISAGTPSGPCPTVPLVARVLRPHRVADVGDLGDVGGEGGRLSVLQDGVGGRYRPEIAGGIGDRGCRAGAHDGVVGRRGRGWRWSWCGSWRWCGGRRGSCDRQGISAGTPSGPCPTVPLVARVLRPHRVADVGDLGDVGGEGGRLSVLQDGVGGRYRPEVAGGIGDCGRRAGEHDGVVGRRGHGWHGNHCRRSILTRSSCTIVLLPHRIADGRSPRRDLAGSAGVLEQGKGIGWHRWPILFSRRRIGLERSPHSAAVVQRHHHLSARLQI